MESGTKCGHTVHPGDAHTGDLTQWKYDEATGLLLTKTDAANKTTTYTYYSTGQLKTRVWARPGTVTTTYTYNAFGDLTNTTYSDSTPAVIITRDRIGRPGEITDASGTRTPAYHSVTGGLDLVAYDAGSLLPSLSVDYTWDTALRPAGYAVSGGGPASIRDYDVAGRLLGVTSYGDTYTHTHGYIPGTGILSSLTTMEGTTEILTRALNHDRMQRLFGITNTHGSAVLSRHGYTLDDAGRRVHATRENGQRWDYGYDDVGQVTSAEKKFPDATAIPGHTFAYQFDGIGNRTSATHGGTGNVVTYTPTPLNQYSEIATDGGRFIMGEAPIANPVVINGDSANPAARAGDLGFFSKHLSETNTTPLWSLDTIVSNNVTISGHTWTPAASVIPAHDFDGNLTFDGRWNYSWDAENRNTRMETTVAAATAGVPRQRLDFVYDSEGRRVAKTVSTSPDGSTWTLSQDLRFLYDGWNLIAEYEMLHWEGGSYLLLQATHTWGIDLSGTPQGAGGVGGLLCSTLTHPDWSTHPYFPAFDGNGNVSAWVGESGSLLARMDYSPFGQLIAQYKFTLANDDSLARLPFGFSTKYTDMETGLLYYGYRHYDPLTGRWPSRDPIGEKGGVNLYGFVGNDGVLCWDKLGQEPRERTIYIIPRQDTSIPLNDRAVQSNLESKATQQTTTLNRFLKQCCCDHTIACHLKAKMDVRAISRTGIPTAPDDKDYHPQDVETEVVLGIQQGHDVYVTFTNATLDGGRAAGMAAKGKNVLLSKNGNAPFMEGNVLAHELGHVVDYVGNEMTLNSVHDVGGGRDADEVSLMASPGGYKLPKQWCEKIDKYFK